MQALQCSTYVLSPRTDLWWLQTEPKANEVLSGASIKHHLVIILISFEEGTANTSLQNVEVKGEAHAYNKPFHSEPAQGVGQGREEHRAVLSSDTSKAAPGWETG